MFLLTVAPIRRGIPVAELSYISKEAPKIGVVILVPLRKKEIPAIVISATEVRDAKAAIKSASFSLRKIDKLKIVNKFSPAFITAANEISNWSISTLGSTIQAIFPSSLLSSETEEEVVLDDIDEVVKVGQDSITYLPSVLQAEEIERIAIYKSHIREIFARNGSVFFILPTIQDIERVDAAIGKGIGSYTYILHSNLTKKQLGDRLREIKESDHPTLVIATPQFLAVPCKNLQSIILERESASSYIMTHKPFIDLRRFVEAYARERRIPLLLGDLFLRVETLSRLEQGELDSFSRPKARYSSAAQTHLVDMRESGEQPAIGRVAFFSKQLVSLISETRKRGASTFILCVRRGVAPMTVCGDCGTVVECSHCKAPLVLHRKSVKKAGTESPTEENANDESVNQNNQVLDTETSTLDENSALGITLPGMGFPTGPATKKTEEFENVFICHRCGEKSDPKHKCENCNSWRLTMLGLGIGQAEEILKSRFPDSPVFRIDTDSVKTHKEAKSRAQAFLTTPGAIMLGTEMALPYLTEPVGLIAVLSVNSLLTIPDFRMSEHVFRLLLVLREKARDHFLIQTREESPTLTLALRGNIGEFLEEELLLRKELHFPPYSIFIKVTFEGNKYKGQEFLSDFNTKLNDLGIPTVNYPKYITKKGNNVLMSALISLPNKSWPNEALSKYLSSLPPNISIRVDPKSIIGD